MPKLRVNRQQLAAFLKDPQAIRAFEQVFDFQSETPATIEEAAQLAGFALAVANAAVSELAQVRELLEQLMLPVAAAAPEPDDTTPRLQVGTLASQNADEIAVTGGTLDGVALVAVTNVAQVPNLYASRAAKADALNSPTVFPAAATDLASVITLANALRAAAISKGL